MNEVFQTNDCLYDLRNPRIPASKHKSPIKYGINKIAFEGLQIWQNICKRIKQIQSLPCHCQICH